jgi:hypothetical protein
MMEERLAVALRVRGVKSTPTRTSDLPKLRPGERTARCVDVTPLRPRPRRSQLLSPTTEGGTVGFKTG